MLRCQFACLLYVCLVLISCARQEQGLPPLGASPESWAAWSPKYPQIQPDGDSSTGSMLNCRTSDSISKVIEFYTGQLEFAGFAVDQKPASGPFDFIGGVEVRVLKAQLRRGREVVTFDLGVQDQGDSRAVVGKWSIDPESAR